jgi:hypothetical protein
LPEKVSHTSTKSLPQLPFKEKTVKRSWFVALLSLLATVAAAAQDTPTAKSGSAAVVAVAGKMLVASNGVRLGVVYRVGPDGSAQIIIEGKLVTIPVTTLSSVEGKLTTSLTKSEVLALR